MKRAYKYRFYPTPEQEAHLKWTFGACRHVWNWALEMRTRAWYDHQERMDQFELSRRLTVYRNGDASWLLDLSCVPIQQVLRDQQQAFNNFWAGRARYPKFKSRKRPVQSCRYNHVGFTLKGAVLKVAKVGRLDVRWSRQIPSAARPYAVTVSRDGANRWFVSVSVETADLEPLAPTDNEVGVDLGITALATLSTGEKVVNERSYERDLVRLRKAQREASRKEPGSANRRKANQKVAKIHVRIADRRKDQLHKFTTDLVRTNDVIAIEDLAVENMRQNRCLSRAISDVGWRTLRTQLEYKTDWYGRELRIVSRWYPSSKRCSACGELAKALPLSIRTWQCPGCKAVHDRDVNAATNILAAGRAVVAGGDGIRRPRHKKKP